MLQSKGGELKGRGCEGRWGRVAGGEGSWRVVGLERSCMGREGGKLDRRVVRREGGGGLREQKERGNIWESTWRVRGRELEDLYLGRVSIEDKMGARGEGS